MRAFADLFAILHGVLLTGFVSVTALLLLVTVANRLRVRHVLLSWRSGRILAFPVAPALFIALVLSFLCYALVTGHGFTPLLFAGYLVGGVLWFLSGLFSASFIVTDCGILRHARQASHAVGWGQVVDYFETTRGNRHEYVFFYLDRAGVRRRFEVHVPAALQVRFQDIVNAKLDPRFDLSVEETLGNRALER